MKKEAQILFLLHCCLQVVSTIVEVSRRGETIRHLLKGGLNMKSKIAKLLYGAKVVAATHIVAKALADNDQFDEYFFKAVVDNSKPANVSDTKHIVRLNDEGTILLVRAQVPQYSTVVATGEVEL